MADFWKLGLHHLDEVDAIISEQIAKDGKEAKTTLKNAKVWDALKLFNNQCGDYIDWLQEEIAREEKEKGITKNDAKLNDLANDVLKNHFGKEV